MNKISRRFLFLLLALLPVACGKMQPDGDGVVRVRYTVSFDAGTKAGEDSVMPGQLLVGVFTPAGTAIDGFKQVVAPTGDAFSFDLNLAVNTSYRIVFLAQAADAYVDAAAFLGSDTGTESLRAVPLDRAASLNSTDGILFHAVKDITTSMGAFSATAVLKRICAQVNIASSTDPAGTVRSLSLSVSGLPTAFDALDGTVSGAGAPRILSGTPLSGETITIDGTDYFRLAYAFLPVGAGKIMSDASVSLFDASEQLIRQTAAGSVPLQANYRTNILGDLVNP
jgi:hypothetical protein